jgi:hypothetical protein
MATKEHLKHQNQYYSPECSLSFRIYLLGWMKFPPFCSSAAAIDTAAFPVEHPTVVCHHVHSPSTLVSLFHFPYVLVKYFALFLSIPTEIVWKVVYVRMQEVHVCTHVAAKVSKMLQQIMYRILVTWRPFISQEVFYNVSEALPCFFFQDVS